MVIYFNFQHVPTAFGLARLGNNGDTNPQMLKLFLQNHKLGNGDCDDFFVIRFSITHEDMTSVEYPYTLNPNEEVPDSLENSLVFFLCVRLSKDVYQTVKTEPFRPHTCYITMDSPGVFPRVLSGVSSGVSPGVSSIHPARTGDLRVSVLKEDGSIHNSSHLTNSICPTDTSIRTNASDLHHTRSCNRSFASQIRSKVSRVPVPSPRDRMEIKPILYPKYSPVTPPHITCYAPPKFSPYARTADLQRTNHPCKKPTRKTSAGLATRDRTRRTTAFLLIRIKPPTGKTPPALHYGNTPTHPKAPKLPPDSPTPPFLPPRPNHPTDPTYFCSPVVSTFDTTSSFTKEIPLSILKRLQRKKSEEIDDHMDIMSPEKIPP